MTSTPPLESIPLSFYIRISYESLDFLHLHTLQPFIAFPYHVIITWGCNQTIFTFSVIPQALRMNTDIGANMQFLCETPFPQQLEKCVLEAIEALMTDTSENGISHLEFRTIKSIVTEHDGTLFEQWRDVLKPYKQQNKKFQTKQGTYLTELTDIRAHIPYLHIYMYMYIHEYIFLHQHISRLYLTVSMM